MLLRMPGGSDYMEAEVLEAVQSGRLSEDAVNTSARRVLELVFRQRQAETFREEAHHALAREAAAAGAVLLKNEGNILPLKKEQKSSSSATWQSSPGIRAPVPPTSIPSGWCRRRRLCPAAPMLPAATNRATPPTA